LNESNEANETARERIVSPEALDAYVRVTKPGVLLIIAALFVIVAALLIWGFTGTLPQTLTANGVWNDNGEIVCYVEVAQLEGDVDGCSAVIRTADGAVFDALVTDVSAYPLSGAEITAAQPNDWLAEMLSVSGYAYAVTLAADSADIKPSAIVSVTLITAEVKPISFIFN
jgi:hypothetical protein